MTHLYKLIQYLALGKHGAVEKREKFNGSLQTEQEVGAANHDGPDDRCN